MRAKRTQSAAHVPFELPPREELGDRVQSVLGVIYLVFNEGYSATAGDDWVRPDCAPMRCGSGESWPNCSRRNRKCTALSP